MDAIENKILIMLDLFENEEQKKDFITTYENPFQSDKIRKIEFTIEKSFWTNHKIAFKSCISFDTGATTGYHRMEANSFPEIVKQTEAFVKSI